MRHHTIRFMPENRVVTIHSGATLLEAAGQAGIILTSPCGGVGRCGKCRLELLPSGKDVLGCQYLVEHDLEVRVPEQSRLLQQQILQHGIGREVPLDPLVQKVYVSGPWRGAESFCESIGSQSNICVHIDGSVERQLEQIAPGQEQAEGATALLFATSSEGHSGGSSRPCYRLVNIERGDTSDSLYGASADIGTTTVVLNLVDLRTGLVVATTSGANPQARYGADVISRIHSASEPEAAIRLQRCIVDCLNVLIEEAAQKAGIPRTSIYETVAAGNTTMNHLLLNLPVAQLGQAPYRAYSLFSCEKPAADLGLTIHPEGKLYTIENIAGFVGSDTVAAALASGMDQAEGPTMLVDIGTNGELVLSVGEKLWAASCAAGPSLEGAGIAFGSPAQDGAIQRVLFDDKDIDTDVIGGGAAKSICGSGLIDAVAVLLDLGVVDETGRFAEQETLFPPLPKAIAKRLTMYEGQPAFEFSAANASLKVALTQKDIRQFQLAKAAIRAGIVLLSEEAGLPEDKLVRILLAGAFGNYIRRESAVRVGLLPGPGVERIRFVGNAAGSGATMTLISRHARDLAGQLARRIKYIEIAQQRRFQEVFSACLLFPDKS